MNTYVVRLTVEGDHHELTIHASDACHAIRQAMAQWHRYVPEEAVVVTARRTHL
jgi:hypothetical protein